MNDSKDLDLVEQTLRQQEEMQNEIENLTAQNKELKKALEGKEAVITDQLSRITRQQYREAEYRKKIKDITTEADDRCRKMQQKMQNAERETAEEEISLSRMQEKHEQETHIYIVVVLVIAIYAAIVTMATFI